MTTDSGKKPFKFTLIKRTPEEPVIVLSSDFIDRSIPWNELIEVQEVTPCPNCERLEDQLYHESRKAPEIEYKLGHEIETLKARLAMLQNQHIEMYNALQSISEDGCDMNHDDTASAATVYVDKLNAKLEKE